MQVTPSIAKAMDGIIAATASEPMKIERMRILISPKKLNTANTAIALAARSLKPHYQRIDGGCLCLGCVALAYAGRPAPKTLDTYSAIFGSSFACAAVRLRTTRSPCSLICAGMSLIRCSPRPRKPPMSACISVTLLSAAR